MNHHSGDFGQLLEDAKKDLAKFKRIIEESHQAHKLAHSTVTTKSKGYGEDRELITSASADLSFVQGRGMTDYERKTGNVPPSYLSYSEFSKAVTKLARTSIDPFSESTDSMVDDSSPLPVSPPPPLDVSIRHLLPGCKLEQKSSTPDAAALASPLGEAGGELVANVAQKSSSSMSMSSLKSPGTQEGDGYEDMDAAAF